MKTNDFFTFYKKYGLFVIIVLLALFFTFAAQGFMTLSNVLNIFKQASIYGILCVGVTIVMVSGGTDMSVGGQAALSGLVMAWAMKAGVPPFIAVIAGILTCMLIGLFNGFFIAFFNTAPIVITLCAKLMLDGLTVVLTKGIPIYDFPKSFYVVGQGFIGDVFPVSIIVLAVAVIIGYLLLQRSYFGRKLFAIGGNREAARLAGINIFKTRVYSYLICSGFVGVASWVLLSKTGSASPTAGASYPFDAMTACMLGGVTFGGGNGNVFTTFLGVLIISMLGNGLLLMGYDNNVQQIIKGLILLLAMCMDAYQKIHTSKASS